MGVITRSSEYLIMKEGAVYQRPTMRRHTEGEAYDKDCLDKINVDYYDYITEGAATHRVHTYSVGKEFRMPRPTVDAREYVPRGVRLSEADFDAHEFTMGCPGCAWLRDKLGPKRMHSKACREIMLRELEGTEEGRSRLERARERFDNYLQTHGPEDEQESKEDDTQGGGNLRRRDLNPKGLMSAHQLKTVTRRTP